MNPSANTENVKDKFSNTIKDQLHAKEPIVESRMNRARIRARGVMQRLRSPMGISLGTIALVAAAGYIYWRYSGVSSAQISRNFRRSLRPMKRSFSSPWGRSASPLRRRFDSFLHA